MADWRKIQTNLWDDPQFKDASTYAKLAFFFVATHYHTTIVGSLRTTVEGLAAELNWEVKQAEEALEELSDGSSPLVRVDAKGALMWAPKLRTWQPIVKINDAIMCGRALNALPNCALKSMIAQEYAEYVADLLPPLRSAFYETLSPVYRIEHRDRDINMHTRYPIAPTETESVIDDALINLVAGLLIAEGWATDGQQGAKATVEYYGVKVVMERLEWGYASKSSRRLRQKLVGGYVRSALRSVGSERAYTAPKELRGFKGGMARKAATMMQTQYIDGDPVMAARRKVALDMTERQRQRLLPLAQAELFREWKIIMKLPGGPAEGWPAWWLDKIGSHASLIHETDQKPAEGDTAERD